MSSHTCTTHQTQGLNFKSRTTQHCPRNSGHNIRQQHRQLSQPQLCFRVKLCSTSGKEQQQGRTGNSSSKLSPLASPQHNHSNPWLLRTLGCHFAEGLRWCLEPVVVKMFLQSAAGRSLATLCDLVLTGHAEGCSGFYVLFGHQGFGTGGRVRGSVWTFRCGPKGYGFDFWDRQRRHQLNLWYGEKKVIAVAGRRGGRSAGVFNCWLVSCQVRLGDMMRPSIACRSNAAE